MMTVILIIVVVVVGLLSAGVRASRVNTQVGRGRGHYVLPFSSLGAPLFSAEPR